MPAASTLIEQSVILIGATNAGNLLVEQSVILISVLDNPPSLSSSSSSSSSSFSPSSSSSSSSMSLAPANYCRRCARLAEPSSKTIEQISMAGNLSIFITLPVAIVTRWASKIPNSGPDTLVINYTDYMGNAASLTRSLTLWMSDSGYVFLSPDQGTQLLIAGVNGNFFDANATQINNRNALALAPGLLPCCNPPRYDAPKLLPNQVRPQLWIRDGSSMSA